jgi:hypothetical protein
MNTYKALLTFDDVNGTVSAQVIENTFEGVPFGWGHDGAGKASIQRTGAFPANYTFTRGTVMNFNGSTAIDGSLMVGVDRTSDDYIEVSVKDKNGDAVSPQQPVPVEFYVY